MTTGENNLSINEALSLDFQQSPWLMDKYKRADSQEQKANHQTLSRDANFMREFIQQSSPAPQTIETLISRLDYVFTYLSFLLPQFLLFRDHVLNRYYRGYWQVQGGGVQTRLMIYKKAKKKVWSLVNKSEIKLNKEFEPEVPCIEE